MFNYFSASVSKPSGTSLTHFSSVRFPTLFFSASNAITWTYTTFAIVIALLVLEQSVYRYKKRHLPGDRWTIPIIGKFADSMKPTMEGYMKQWDSGALSALSVFNMLALAAFCFGNGSSFPFVSFIVMASTTEYSRKILNSPAHAEPCLVYAAKQILLPDNWYQFSFHSAATRNHVNSLSQGFLDWKGTRRIPPQSQPSLHSQSTRVGFDEMP